MGRRPVPHVLAAVAGLLVLAACTATPPNVATYESDGSGEDALMSGTLRVDDACVTLVGEDGTVTVPVFPRGQVALDGTDLELAGHTWADGERIELGGGEGTSAEPFTVPEGCPDGPFWVVAPR